jgi:hypothetical protein
MTNASVTITTPLTAIASAGTTMSGTLVVTGLVTGAGTVLSTHVHVISSGSSAGSTAIPT